ncbi:MAG: DUF4139 domain-containing protein [Candidatus Kapabacteria bacterium]|nr:DUF4139 domain-containing protein [Candidatus Kapabacteria bacterium]
MKTMFVFVCATVLCSMIGIAQTPLPTKQVSIFKNGSCMFTKEGTLPLKDNVLRLPVPNAISSTYWLNTPGEKLIKSVAYKTEMIKVKRDVTRLEELLELNIGKTITFETQRVEQQQTYIQHSGKLLGVNRQLNTFKIADKTGTHYFSTSVLQNNVLNFSIDDAVDTRMTDSSARYAIITPVKSLSEMTIQEISLQNGVQWIPSYSLKLTGSKEARLEMKALVENFSQEDITNADADVIVGVPQLYFSKLTDPATSPSFTQVTAPQVTNAYDNNRVQAMSNTASAMSVRGGRESSSSYRTDASSAAPPSYDISYEADAEQSNDIFVYKLGNISVDKYSKVSFPVFATTVEYKDIHECDIPDFTNFEYTRNVSGTEGNYDVFHSIELRNTTNYPLTTAGVIVTDDKNRFLAQDMLKYIPKNGKGNIRLSKAINITLKCSEEELQRTENVKRIAKVNYNKVRVKGTISVENFNEGEVTIKVKKNVNGVIVVSNNGKVRKRSESFTTNPQSEVTWEVSLKSGEKQEIPYEYESLFRQ